MVDHHIARELRRPIRIIDDRIVAESDIASAVDRDRGALRVPEAIVTYRDVRYRHLSGQMKADIDRPLRICICKIIVINRDIARQRSSSPRRIVPNSNRFIVVCESITLDASPDAINQHYTARKGKCVVADNCILSGRIHVYH